jgi:hypothetical protein
MSEVCVSGNAWRIYRRTKPANKELQELDAATGATLMGLAASARTVPPGDCRGRYAGATMTISGVAQPMHCTRLDAVGT